MKKILIALSALVLVTGCMQNTNSRVYNSRETMQTRTVSKGTVTHVSPVRIEGDKVVGTIGGAIIGAAAGSSIGGGDTVPLITGTLGAIAGGAAGRAADDAITGENGYEYIIKLRKNGNLISVVQADEAPFAVGEKVFILKNRDQTRVVKDTE